MALSDVSPACLLAALNWLDVKSLRVLLHAKDPRCYRLSKRPNCFRGTCSGLGTWQPRCTRGALSGTRHDVPVRPLTLITPPIALVAATPSGVANPITPASYMTRASALVPVPFPQLSPRVLSYRPITPNPCTLGQQVTVVLSCLIVLSRLVYFYPGS